MKTCVSTFCESPMKVFCHDHKVILCYGCKDKFHDSCDIEEIADLDRIKENIDFLQNLLDTMLEAQERFEAESHVSDLDGFISILQESITRINEDLQEAIEQDQFLNFNDLFDSISQIKKEMMEDTIFYNFCNFNFKLNTFQKTRAKKEACDKDLEAAKETEKTSVDDSQNNLEDEKTGYNNADEASEDTDLSKLYEKTMNSKLCPKSLEKLDIDLSIERDIQFINEVLNKKISIGQLKSLTINDCYQEKDVLWNILSYPGIQTLEKLTLDSSNSDAGFVETRPGFLIDLLEKIQHLPKLLCMDHWKFQDTDFSKLVSSCHDCEILHIKNMHCTERLNFCFNKKTDYKIKALILQTKGSDHRFDFYTMTYLLKEIAISPLKNSLEQLYLSEHIIQGRLSDLNLLCKLHYSKSLQLIQILFNWKIESSY